MQVSLKYSMWRVSHSRLCENKLRSWKLTWSQWQRQYDERDTGTEVDCISSGLPHCCGNTTLRVWLNLSQ